MAASPHQWCPSQLSSTSVGNHEFAKPMRSQAAHGRASSPRDVGEEHAGEEHAGEITTRRPWPRKCCLRLRPYSATRSLRRRASASRRRHETDKNFSNRIQGIGSPPANCREDRAPDNAVGPFDMGRAT
jgi:hypothetical protein